MSDPTVRSHESPIVSQGRFELRTIPELRGYGPGRAVILTGPGVKRLISAYELSLSLLTGLLTRRYTHYTVIDTAARQTSRTETRRISSDPRYTFKLVIAMAARVADPVAYLNDFSPNASIFDSFYSELLGDISNALADCHPDDLPEAQQRISAWAASIRKSQPYHKGVQISQFNITLEYGQELARRIQALEHLDMHEKFGDKYFVIEGAMDPSIQGRNKSLIDDLHNIEKHPRERKDDEFNRGLEAMRKLQEVTGEDIAKIVRHSKIYDSLGRLVDPPQSRERPSSVRLPRMHGERRDPTTSGLSIGEMVRWSAVRVFRWFERSNKGSDPDQVDFSVFCPPAGAPGAAILIQVFLHAPEHTERAQFAATMMDAATTLKGSQTLQVVIARGSVVTVSLRVAGLHIDEPQQTVIWQGEPVFCQFLVTMPEASDGSSIHPVVRISVGGGLVGRIVFSIAVEVSAVGPQSRPADQTAFRYEHAFLSYASADRKEVLKRAQVLKAAGVSFFQDVLSLDPGDRWEREIYKNIDECDLFLLFWSEAAKNSTWVIKEAEYALELQAARQMPDVVPVILQTPPPLPPPSSLASIHFDDRIHYLIAASDEGALTEQRRQKFDAPPERAHPDLNNVFDSIDDLHRTIEQVAHDSARSGQVEALKITVRRLLGHLEQVGLASTAEVGMRADPHLHHVVLSLRSALQRGTILRVDAQGYRDVKTGGIVREAKVVVSSGEAVANNP